MQTAIKRIKEWFVAPVFPDDEDKTRNARVLYTILGNVLAIMVLATLAMIFISVQKIGIGILLCILLILVLGSRALVQRDRVLAASKLFVGGMWIAFALLYVLGGRTASSATNLLMAITVTAGLLLGRRATIILAIFSSVIGLGMAVLETAGYPLVHFFPGPPIPSWTTWTLAFFLVLSPLNLTIQSIVRSTQVIRESEERLKFVLEGSQLGYWDWNIETGQVHRNTRWAEMLGYTLEEIKLTVKQWTDLHHPDDREHAWQSIQDHLEGRTSEHKIEYRMRTKDGGYKWILDQAKIVKRDSQGKPTRMSGTHTDITERRQTENIIQARLRVNEFAREHPLDKLLQNSLDELCAITDSPIGFFHFVEPDQRTLSLQAWSTRTIEEMCTAEGKGHSYDIDLAGVWVDCMRQGAPVIHNDYASLPYRRGLPEGHAPIVREMVFPIIRDNKMVAIIGVGNKAQNYTDGDLILASRLADILWDITERKRAEEREREQRTLAEALSASAAALNSTLDFEDVLDRIMDNVGHVVPHDAVDIILLDAEHQTAQIVGHRNTRRQPAEMKGLQFTISQTRNLREMQETGAPVIIPDTSAYDGWVETPFSTWINANLGVPIEIKNEIIGFLSLASARPNAFTPLDAERLQAFVDHAAIAIENAQLYEEVQRLAVTDTLTGLFNRAFFNAELTRLESGRDYPVSIVVADLDDLKVINDTHGHPVGDETLRRVAEILQSVFRASDILTRIGGDEFGILLPRADAVAVEQMLSRIQEKLREHNAEHPDLPFNLSLGASTAEQGDLAKAFAVADQRMYTDKATHKS